MSQITVELDDDAFSVLDPATGTRRHMILKPVEYSKAKSKDAPSDTTNTINSTPEEGKTNTPSDAQASGTEAVRATLSMDSIVRMDSTANEALGGLYPHQEYALSFYKGQRVRGRIYYIARGAGKTPLLVNIAKESNAENVLYMAPGSLTEVFMSHLHFAKEDPKRKNASGNLRYHTMATNAGNMDKQWKEYIDSTDLLVDKSNYMQTGDAHTLIIIDEFHTFCKRIANVINRLNYGKTLGTTYEDKGVYDVYKALVELQNIQVILASGSLVDNSPFEIVPAVNMAVGLIRSATGLKGLALPEDHRGFYFTFVKAFDAHLFGTRIKDVFFSYDIPRGIPSLSIPEIKRHPPLCIMMQNAQAVGYSEAKTKESIIESQMKREVLNIEGYPALHTQGVYRSFTRLASNYVFPPELAVTEDKLDLIEAKYLTMDELKQRGIKLWFCLDIMLNGAWIDKNGVFHPEEHVKGIYRKDGFKKVAMTKENEAEAAPIAITEENKGDVATGAQKKKAPKKESFYDLPRTSKETGALVFGLNGIGVSGSIKINTDGVKKTDEDLEGFAKEVVDNTIKILEGGAKKVPTTETKKTIKEPAHNTSMHRERRRIGLYTYFVDIYGIGILEKYMQAFGYVNMHTLRARSVDDLRTYLEKNKGTKLYVKLTGNESSKEKDAILKLSNRAMKEDLIDVVLYSGAASHGLTIRGIDIMISVDLGWSREILEQAISRFSRLGGNEFLTRFHKRNAKGKIILDSNGQPIYTEQPYIDVVELLAVLPSGDTVDEILQTTGYIKEEHNRRFDAEVRANSINCSEMLPAENKLAAEFIKKGDVPPARTFFRCNSCVDERTPLIQMQVGPKCKINPPSTGKTKSIKMLNPINVEDKDEHVYVGDTSTGMIWQDDTLVENNDVYRAVWSTLLR